VVSRFTSRILLIQNLVQSKLKDKFHWDAFISWMEHTLSTKDESWTQLQLLISFLWHRILFKKKSYSLEIWYETCFSDDNPWIWEYFTKYINNIYSRSTIWLNFTSSHVKMFRWKEHHSEAQYMYFSRL
jgi:hypothetical protein